MRIPLIRAVLVSAVLFVLAATSASGASYIGAAGHELRSNPVYVDPTANPSITDEQADELRDIIRNGDRPLYIAVLSSAVKSEVHGNANLLPKAVGQTTGLSGTYAVAAGPVFRAASSKSANFSAASRLASESYQAHRQDGMFAVLKDFATRVEAKPAKHTSVLVWIGIVLLVLALIGIGIWSFIKRQQFNGRKDRCQVMIDDLQEEVNGLIVSDDTNVSDLASKANTALTSAQKNLKKASNRYDLDNVEEQIARANELISEAKNPTMEDDMSLSDWRRRRRNRTSGSAPTRSARDDAREAARNRQAATNAPRGYVPVDQRPQPSVVVNTSHYYNGTGFGYYQQYGGYGYWDPYGNFVTDLLMWDLLTDATFDDHETVIENNYYGDTGQPDATFTDDNVGGGGDWDSDNSIPDDTTGGGGDWDSGSSDVSYADTSPA